MRMFSLVLFLALAMTSSASAADETRAGGLVISHVYARPVPAGVRNGAVYMRIINNGAEPDTLVSASTDRAEAVELHGSMMGDDGVMRMRRADEVEIVAGVPAVFAPGSLHVMLIGLKGPLVEGEAFPLTLTFARAGEVTVDVYVTREDYDAEGNAETPAPDHAPAHQGH